MSKVKFRIGLIVPSSNTTMEVELYRMAPSDITIHVDRMYLTRATYEQWQRMNEDIIRCCQYLSSAKVNIIIFGCTGASFAEGVGYDRHIEKMMTDAVGIPAITTARALLEGIREVSANKVALASPYSKDVHQRGERFLRGNNIEILSSQYMGDEYVENTKLGLLGPESAEKAAQKVDCSEAQAIVLSCTNWRTIEVIKKLEKSLRKPIISSNQASLWAALKSLNYSSSLTGWGKLMSLLNIKKERVD